VRVSTQHCTVCGAPRTTCDPACRFCHTLFAGESAGPAPVPDVPASILAEIDRGNLIGAIKIHRQSFGTSLRDAKNAVEAIAAKRRR
jgi:hypothetical protein